MYTSLFSFSRNRIEIFSGATPHHLSLKYFSMVWGGTKRNFREKENKNSGKVFNFSVFQFFNFSIFHFTLRWNRDTQYSTGNMTAEQNSTSYIYFQTSTILRGVCRSVFNSVFVFSGNETEIWMGEDLDTVHIPCAEFQVQIQKCSFIPWLGCNTV